MPLLALKIDVDTWRGTREGVPRLVALLKSHGADGTFLFSLGPDHTGRAIRRVFRPGFLDKVTRTSVIEHYGIRTLLYGTLLPGPDIGRREAALMRSVRDQGFEVGIHTWDHVAWQDQVVTRSAAWTRHQMQLAAQRFGEIFGEPARTHGAAGWQMNDAAFACEREIGFACASDVRGRGPFQPANERGEAFGVPQLPTTLPTLDELIGRDGCTAENAHRHLLARTETLVPGVQVFTLHAELEGRRFSRTLDRLLTGWRAQGYRLVSLREQLAQLDPPRLPRCTVTRGEVAGRSGTLSLQGEVVG
jgi:undecaprenyl phosphate-alpha-L-ara4FN deformylase